MARYSQYNQDMFLDEKIFKGKRGGVFLEAGAIDGKYLSNTYLFATEREWKGICIEPRQEHFEALKSNRPESKCFCCALSDVPGRHEFVKIFGYSSGLSGLKSKADPQHMHRVKGSVKKGKSRLEETIVETRLVMDLLEEAAISKLDLFCLDIEGGELDVLKSIDFSKVQIDVFQIENEYGDIEGLRKWVISAGYEFVHRCSIDDIFIRVGSGLSLI